MKVDKDIDLQSFRNKFSSKDECYKHLSDFKWSEGYECKKCKNIYFIKGKQAHSKRCRKCGYDESTTKGTLFEHLRFDIDKAFGMLYEIVTRKKGVSSIELAERFNVNQKTAWAFRQKVQAVMLSSEQYPLKDEVHVDEFEIGTPQKGEQGRSASEKKIRVVIAVEHRDGKAGRAYARVIQDYSSDSLKPIFEHHIEKHAQIVADKWSGYKPLKKEYPNLKQILSDKGQNFKMLHLQIRNFKNWLRGTHSYCNKQYIQKYINEYFFRFNRRNHRQTIFDRIFDRCMLAKPIKISQLKGLEI